MIGCASMNDSVIIQYRIHKAFLALHVTCIWCYATPGTLHKRGPVVLYPCYANVTFADHSIWYVSISREEVSINVRFYWRLHNDSSDYSFFHHSTISHLNVMHPSLVICAIHNAFATCPRSMLEKFTEKPFNLAPRRRSRVNPSSMPIHKR